MAQILLSEAGASFHLRKRLNTFGGSPEHDVRIAGGSAAIGFSLLLEKNGGALLPGALKVKVNGLSASRRTPLRHCDRLEWKGGAAVFLDSALPVQGSAAAASESLEPLKILQNLAASLRQEGSGAVNQALEAIVQLAGAEEGYLLTECKAQGEWLMVASEGAGEHRKRGLFSSTILKEALHRRTPVYVESIVGHPYAESASVIAARVFSVACFPLVLNEEILGAVFLYTRTPGKAIDHNRLPEVNLLATQVALLLALNLRARAPFAPGANFLFHEQSPMVDVDKKIRKLSATPVSILLTGETGTGKEVVASALHARSSRGDGPFVAVNCAAIPATLLESVLFGHERGAFTGAVKAQTGKFQQANGGTLFLDEIGDLPLDLQAKLLRVLQEKKVEPIGAERAQSIDIRVIAATHQDLELAVKEKRFRQDLFFRLAGAKISLPPLRDRTPDISLLARHFLEKLDAQKSFTPECLDLMQRYPWPGNVRELEQAVMRAHYLSDGTSVEASHLELEPASAGENEQFWESFADLTAAQSAFTRQLVEKTLRKHAGNRQQTAERLGISERTLYRILADSPV